MRTFMNGLRRNLINTVFATLCLVVVSGCFAANAMTVNAAEVTQAPQIFDMILFFGQSNMVGSAIGTENPFDTTAESLEQISQESGIDLDILQSVHVSTSASVEIPENIAYDYWLVSDRLVPVTGDYKPGESGIDSNGSYIGIKYDEASGKFVRSYLVNGQQDGAMSASASGCTNLLSAFCAEYYKKTGHGVLAVNVAVGGSPIAKFLPMSDPDYNTSFIYSDHMWDCIEESVRGALQKAKDENITIQNRYFVSYQGEGDLGNTRYVSEYKKVVTNLHMLSFTNGALIETSNFIGQSDLAAGVKQMHQWQEQLISEDPNLCLGSSLDYDHYLPDKATYEGADDTWRKMWNNLPYDEAFRRASLLTDTVYDNRIHLNSAALAMIGRQAADSLSTFTLR